MDKDVSNGLAKTGASLGRLWTRVWGERGITLGTKRQVHKAVPSLRLWNLAAIQKKLDQFHLRCLHVVMGISWEDRLSNTELLRRGNMPCIEALMTKAKLGGLDMWFGCRMDDARLPKMVFFSDLATGERSIGHPLKRFKDDLKQRTELNPILGWETLTADHSAWRMVVHKGDQGFVKSGCTTSTRPLGWPGSSCAKAAS